MKLRSIMSALALSAAVGSMCWADVTGKVTLDGKAPEMKSIDMSGVKECNDQHSDPMMEETLVAGEKGELANVVVYLKKEEGMDLAGEVPKEPAVLDQKGCMYTPHVLPVMVGQDVLVKNDDPFLHNVHALAEKNAAFNFGQSNKNPGQKIPEPMKTTETFKVKCDVHPWMNAWIVVLDHPYFAASKEDGTFAIKNVPDGEYTFVAWQEKLGAQEVKATVKDGKAELNFTFKAEGARANPTDAVAAKECKLGGACCSVKATTVAKTN